MSCDQIVGMISALIDYVKLITIRQRVITLKTFYIKDGWLAPEGKVGELHTTAYVGSAMNRQEV